MILWMSEYLFDRIFDVLYIYTLLVIFINLIELFKFITMNNNHVIIQFHNYTRKICGAIFLWGRTMNHNHDNILILRDFAKHFPLSTKLYNSEIVWRSSRNIKYFKGTNFCGYNFFAISRIFWPSKKKSREIVVYPESREISFDICARK